MYQQDTQFKNYPPLKAKKGSTTFRISDKTTGELKTKNIIWTTVAFYKTQLRLAVIW